jgi:hypothetical protein
VAGHSQSIDGYLATPGGDAIETFCLCQIYPDTLRITHLTERAGVNSELLTWVKSGRADFENEGEARAGKDRLRGIEFCQQVFDALIVSRLGEMVERNG